MLTAALDRVDSALLAAPRVGYAQAPEIIQYESADCHFLGMMMPRHADRHVASVTGTAAHTNSLVTACFLIDRWRDGPLFDEAFGFNLEDHDFGVRARLLGHELWIEPAACVLHGGGTPGLSYRPGLDPTRSRIFFLVRNHWFVLIKAFSTRTLCLLLPALCLYELAQLVFLGASGMGRPWLAAVASLRREWPSLREKRRAIRSTRRVVDRLIVQQGALPLTDWVQDGTARRRVARLLETMLNGHYRCVRRFL